MKAIVLVALLLVATLGGVAAGPNSSDQSTATVDLSKAGGPIFYVLCAGGTSLANCQGPTFWQESNTVGGLQPGHVVVDNKRFDPDGRILV